MTKEQITQILIDNSEHILDYLDNDRIAVEKEDFSDVADAILKLCEVSGSANDFEKDLFKLVNDYCNQGLKKPDLVKKIEWVLGSCKMS